MTAPSIERRSPALLTLAITLVYLLGIGGIIAGVAVAGGDGNGASAGGGATTTTAEISLTEFAITGNLTVPAGKVILNVTNHGTVEHNFHIVDLDRTTKDLGAGATESIVLNDVAPGTYTIVCEIAGHKDSGMEATLTVTEPGAAASATPTTAAEHEMTHAEAMEIDAKMMKSMQTFGTDAAATEGAGNQPLVPTIAADGAKEFSLTAAVTKWEIEPGKIVDAWTYNGQVPGPWIKVAVGDTVRITVHNELTLGTDVHFHGIHTPNSFDGVAPYTQTMIMQGEEFTYEFVADQPAVGMYHAHMHGEEAVPNGMFGVFQIGDVPLPAGRTVSGVKIPDDVRIVQEIPMVLNDAGAIGYSLNGKSFPSTAPVSVNLGDWFLVNYYNEGLQNHPMHMHGFPQLIVAKDGIPLDQPYWADTILIGPGERYSVLVHATDPGVWVWHCHILNHVEMKDRLFGMATAVIVNDPTKAA